MANPSPHLHLPDSSSIGSPQTASAVLASSSSSPPPPPPPCNNVKDSELSMETSSSACSCSASSSSETCSSNADQRLNNQRSRRDRETEARNGGKRGRGSRSEEEEEEEAARRNGGGVTGGNSRGGQTCQRNGRKEKIQKCKVKKEIDAASGGHADDMQEVLGMRRRFHGNLCFKCAAGFTADCAAVCCCPLALLHLAAMAFIRLPSAMVWKMLLNLKNKSCLKKKPLKKKKNKQKQKKERTGEIETEEEEEEVNDSDGHDNDETVKPPWRRGSPAQEAYMSRPTSPFLHLHHHHHHHGVQIVSFDSENLFQHFQTEQMDFGGFVQKTE